LGKEKGLFVGEMEMTAEQERAVLYIQMNKSMFFTYIKFYVNNLFIYIWYRS